MKQLAEVVPENLFIQIPEQVERFNADIGSLEAALQQAPEVFKSVGVNLPINVLFRMVNNLVGVVGFEPVVGRQGVSIDRAPRCNVEPDFVLQVFLPASGDYHSANLALALQDAEHGGLVLSARTSDAAATNVAVHVPRSAADEGFVHFNALPVAADFQERTGLHRKANAVEHEPSRLLGDAKSPRHFVRANPVLAVGDHPDRYQPLVQRKRRILKDSPDLDAELPVVVDALALPLALILEKARIRPSTGGTLDPMRPAQLGDQPDAIVGIREVDDGFLERLGFVVHVRVPHSPYTTRWTLICQVYYCPFLESGLSGTGRK